MHKYDTRHDLCTPSDTPHLASTQNVNKSIQQRVNNDYLAFPAFLLKKIFDIDIDIDINFGYRCIIVSLDIDIINIY